MTDQATFADEIASTGPAGRPRGFHVNRNHKSLMGRSIALRIGLAAYVLLHVGVVGISIYGVGFVDSIINETYRDEVEVYDSGIFLDNTSTVLSFGLLGTFLYCIVAYCVFVYRAASNIENANAAGLSVSPGWAVGWSFIPFVNLFKIFQVMREIWTASADPKRGVHGGSMLLPVWWISYVTGNLIGTFASRMADAQLKSAFPDLEQIRTVFFIQAGTSCLAILAGVLLFLIVGGVTRNQANWKSIPDAEPAAPPAASALGF